MDNFCWYGNEQVHKQHPYVGAHLLGEPNGPKK